MSVKKNGQGRVKDPANDRRIAANRGFVPTGQGKRKRDDDRRLASVRGKPSGQGRVKDEAHDKRLAKNRTSSTGQGRVKNPVHDGRLIQNRRKKENTDKAITNVIS